jgi:hypothetical protein
MRTTSLHGRVILNGEMSTIFNSWAPDAAGCLEGAVVRGVAGHYNHGLLGAGAGCLIGRHYAKKHARQEMNNNNTGYDSSKYNAGQYR